MAERLSTGFADAVNTLDAVKNIMASSVIHIYSGTQPTTADLAETGTLLMIITKDSAPFVPGVATNGLNMNASSGGVLSKDAGETWSGVGIAAGVAGWFRWYDNDVVTGDSTTAVRIDGAIGSTTSYEMQMSSTVITVDGPSAVNAFTYTTTKQ